MQNFWALGASPPEPHWPPAAGSSAPDPQTSPPHCEFLATRLIARLGYDLDLNVSARLIFAEIARLPKRLLFLPAQICCADKIKLISAQRNDSMQ